MKCPQCNKPLADLTRICNFCKADLELLVDYVRNLQGGLERADQLTRAGALGKAVWEYLAVLEVDPDNPAARRQVGQVATAVRQFDSMSPRRRWLRARRGWGDLLAELSPSLLLEIGLWLLLMLAAFSVGYYVGTPQGTSGPSLPPESSQNQTMGGK
jgi:hypothetical protein